MTFFILIQISEAKRFHLNTGGPASKYYLSGYFGIIWHIFSDFFCILIRNWKGRLYCFIQETL